jgi:hypothetical protein
MKSSHILALFLLSLPPSHSVAQFISIGIPQPDQNSGTIGRSFGFNGPPRGQQWLEVIEAMLRSRDRAWVNSADANICLYGDKDVVEALHQLYFADGLSDYRDQIVRPLAGLQQESAVLAAQEILLSPEYPPDHPLVTQSAHSVLRKLGRNGVMTIMEKLHQWGSLPGDGEIDSWPGQALLPIIKEKVSTAQIGVLREIFQDQSARNTGARYAAADALGAVSTAADVAWAQEMMAAETNGLVKEKLADLVTALSKQNTADNQE